MPRPWEVFDADQAQRGDVLCLSVLRSLLDGAIVVFRGSMGAVAELLARFCRVIYSTSLSSVGKRETFARCVVLLEQGKLSEITADDLPSAYWPREYKSMVESSYTHPTYVPAQLVWSVYANVFDRFATPTNDWLRRRFSTRKIRYVETLLGLILSVRARVFVPDAVVIDLLLGAYLSPRSPLPHDLAGSTVVEPCTGSGVLGIACGMLGARHVVSSDVDEVSVACARENMARHGLAHRFDARHADGIPADVATQVVLMNPPWYDRAGSTDTPGYLRRCLEDPGRGLLHRILQDASACGASVAYVFFGTDDPFVVDVGRPLDPWVVGRRWDGARGVRIQRLVRT